MVGFRLGGKGRCGTPAEPEDTQKLKLWETARRRPKDPNRHPEGRGCGSRRPVGGVGGVGGCGYGAAQEKPKTTMRAVDLFAGAGGFTEGAKQAGVEVVWAANHWPLAVQVHAAAHPDTEHVCQDLRQADWTKLPEFDLLLASPACQGHSAASQPRRRPKHDTDRATAWAVVDAVEICRPEAGFIVENVPAFVRWPLYDLWQAAFRRLGYRTTEVYLTASHHGVPQRRKRLFVVGVPDKRRRKAAITPPGPATEPGFGAHIDWDAGGWKPVAGATDGVKARIQRGRRRWGRRFLAQWVTGHSGVPLDEPIRTITCAPNHWHLVDGDRYRPLTAVELRRAMGFRDDYPVEIGGAGKRDVTRLLGNAVCPPVARWLIERAFG